MIRAMTRISEAYHSCRLVDFGEGPIISERPKKFI
jgi:hypothetical protein